MSRLAQRPTRRTRAKHGDIEKPSIEARLLAAMEQLLEGGQRFASVSVEQLTEAAGMSRGTFYLHFRDKAELVARLMSLVTDEIVESCGTWLGDADNASRQDLQAALGGVVHTFKQHQAIIAAVTDTAPHDAKVAALFQTMMDTLVAQNRRAIAAVRRKSGRRKAASDPLAHALTWMVVLYCARFVGDRKGAAIERMAQSLGQVCASSVFAEGG